MNLQENCKKGLRGENGNAIKRPLATQRSTEDTVPCRLENFRSPRKKGLFICPRFQGLQPLSGSGVAARFSHRPSAAVHRRFFLTMADSQVQH